ncbi:MAG: hypothetical protein JST93_34120 [Acidobacteria bacterium]|nr:hypothetical protein [Acidobacteriota bacterium]
MKVLDISRNDTIPKNPAVYLKVEPAQVTVGLLGAVVLLAAASVLLRAFSAFTGHDYVYGLIPLFDLEREANIPTIFSAGLLSISAGLLSLIAIEKHQSRDGLRRPWAVLACGFLFMAVDELARIHELLVAPTRQWLGRDQLGPLYFAWVVPGFALVAVLALYFVPFLRALPRRDALRFLSAGAVYLGGALGVELAGGNAAEQGGVQQPLYVALVTLEESMEMTGAVLFIRALLLYIAQWSPSLRVELRLS